MIYKIKPDNEIIITRIDDFDYLNNPNWVYVKCDIDDTLIKCLISFIKSKFKNTSYYVIETINTTIKIKFLALYKEQSIYIFLETMFLYNDMLYILIHDLMENYNEFNINSKKFELMKNRLLKLNKII